MSDEAPGLYALDANVFIEAHRRYYALDLCPGFWDCLQHYCGTHRVLSIDRVRIEILDGDELADWVADAPATLFASTADAEVARVFGEMMLWVQDQPQFLEAAKAEFARAADGWLVAFAAVHGATVVTHEVFSANARRRVPIPNVCREFGVAYANTFDMLRSLEVRFGWAAA